MNQYVSLIPFAFGECGATGEKPPFAASAGALAWSAADATRRSAAAKGRRSTAWHSMKVSGRRSTANRRLPVSAIAPGVQRWRVVLPPEVAGPIEVFVNGVPQREGEDYDREGAQLAFR